MPETQIEREKLEPLIEDLKKASHHWAKLDSLIKKYQGEHIGGPLNRQALSDVCFPLIQQLRQRIGERVEKMVDHEEVILEEAQ